MAVFRIEKTRDYTVMANHHLRNTALSLKAKGLLSLMLSLPEDWDYTTKGLARICRDGVDSICATVRELEDAGYIIRERVRNANGRLGSIEYTILEQPRPPEPKPGKPERENPVQVKPVLDSPVLGKPEQENPAQLNTKGSSKQISNTDSSSTEESNPIQSSPQTPTGVSRTGRDWMRERENYRELILENIEYAYLCRDDRLDRDMLNELVELMVDTVCSRRETIRIAGDDYLTTTRSCRRWNWRKRMCRGCLWASAISFCWSAANCCVRRRSLSCMKRSRPPLIAADIPSRQRESRCFPRAGGPSRRCSVPP